MGTSRFKRAGGFLNGVDGVIRDYQFTDEFNGEAFVPGRDPKTKKDKFHALNGVLFVRADGATEDVTTTLFAGGYDDFSVSDDGHVLTPETEGYMLGGGTAFAKLIQSLEAAGHPGAQTDDESVIDFTPIIGWRVRFVQKTNAEDTKRLGKRKGKDGKEYDRNDLVIDTVYEQVGAGTPAKPAAKAKDAKKGTKAAKGAPAPVDIPALASTALVGVLSGPMKKQKVGMEVLKALMEDPSRDEVRTWLFDDANLEGLVKSGVIEAYDRKTTVITPVEPEEDEASDE